MLFSSIPFLYYFLPCTLVCYFIAPVRFKNIVLLLFSMIFYAWGEPTYLILMITSILLGFMEGIFIEQIKNQKLSFTVLLLSICIHCGILIYFKYMNFFIENLMTIGVSFSLVKVALPLGISFYTFQLISYLVDIYRKQNAAEKNIIIFGTYICLFPQLIAGPIVRYRDIANQLRNRIHNMENVSIGFRLFIIGLSKKVLLANTLGELCQQALISQDPSILYYWLYAFAFTLQVYFDFSGYSDMAVGLGRIFGFHFPKNFQYPLIAKSITDFWRTWHITLGTWFRDYIYIPLKGNRVKKIRWMFHIFVVWCLTGLWHGASWNFIIWGLLFAVLLLIEKCGFSSFLHRHPYFAHFYVILCIMISFVIFNATNMKEAMYHIRIMFNAESLPLYSLEFCYYLKSYSMILLISVIAATPCMKHIVGKAKQTKKWTYLINGLEPIVLTCLLILTSASFINDSYNPFLYFRF